MWELPGVGIHRQGPQDAGVVVETRVQVLDEKIGDRSTCIVKEEEDGAEFVMCK